MRKILKSIFGAVAFLCSLGVGSYAAPDSINTDSVSASTTLSNSNRTAAATANHDAGGIVNSVQNSGKYYVEVQFPTTANGSTGIGLFNTDTAAWPANPGIGNYFGQSGQSPIFYPAGTGSIETNGTALVTGIGSYSTSSWYGLAMDLDNRKFWVRKDSGNWNNSGSDNPATNTGGVDMSTLTGPLFLAMSLKTNGDSIALNLGQTAFAQSVPSGFTSGWPIPAITRNTDGPLPIKYTTSNPDDFQNIMFYGKVILTQRVLLDTIRWYVNQNSGAGIKWKVIVVPDSAGSPGAVSSAVFTGSVSTVIALGGNDVAVGGVKLAAGTWWIGLAVSVSSGTVKSYINSKDAGSNQYKAISDASATLPDCCTGFSGFTDIPTMEIFTTAINGARQRAIIIP